jgi:formyltetrahydrofolate deformylase
MTSTLIVTLRCADQRGIVKAVADTVFDVNGNIVDSAQFWDEPSNSFSLRMEIQVPAVDEYRLRQLLDSNLARFTPIISVRSLLKRRRALVMVTTADHCLRELLYQWQAGELSADIAGVVSNHETLRPVAEQFGVPFVVIPVTNDSKKSAEESLAQHVTEWDADFIVLARYMQVLTDEFCDRYAGRIINIHHSFLPGFKGAKPYHQAYDRGVKLIGATAHYVTTDLDEGPIIEQDVVRVGHHHSAEQLVSIGRDVERRVLARAVRLHAEDRVFPNGTRTVVFDS